MRRVFLKFDLEPDPRILTGRETDWPGFVALFDYLSSARAQLEDKSGAPVHFTWQFRIDPHIASVFGTPDWVLRNHEDKISAIAQTGDEIGIHVHTWRPVRRFLRTVWMPDFEDDGWAVECIESACDHYKDFFAVQASTISISDGFMSNGIMSALARLGLRADSTLTPGYISAEDTSPRERSIGRPPDTPTTPTHPYKPSKTDFRVAGDPSWDVWELSSAAGVVAHEINGLPSVRKLLLGMSPAQAKAICRANAGAEHIGADCRSDVLTHPDTARRMREVLENHEEYFGDHARFVTCRSVCNHLDQAGSV